MKILAANIIFNHPHNDYIITVAFESSPGFWRACFKQVNDISLDAFQLVAKTGEKLSENRASQLFEVSLVHRHKYDS